MFEERFPGADFFVEVWIHCAALGEPGQRETDCATVFVEGGGHGVWRQPGELLGAMDRQPARQECLFLAVARHETLDGYGVRLADGRDDEHDSLRVVLGLGMAQRSREAAAGQDWHGRNGWTRTDRDWQRCAHKFQHFSFSAFQIFWVGGPSRLRRVMLVAVLLEWSHSR